MDRHRVVFVTERGERHQQNALAAAPAELDITMLRAPDRAALRQALAAAEYFISERAGEIDADLIAAAPRLKLIQRLGSLTYDIDLAAARTADVAVCYWPVDSVIRVAEHAVMQMLALAKKLREAEKVALAASEEWGTSRRTDEDTFAYNWSGRQGVEQLWQRRVGILGFGEIGVELARRLAGWGSEIGYHKRRRLPEAVEAELGLTYRPFDELAAESDYLVNLLPYAAATDQLLDAAFFERLKAGAFLVSCGSGSVIDEHALAAALKNGRLAGAALDTFEWEPLRARNPLLALAREGFNVLLTPHTAAGSVEEAEIAQARRQDYSNLERHLAGEPLLYRVA